MDLRGRLCRIDQPIHAKNVAFNFTLDCLYSNILYVK